jgi:hypothetical protein
MVFIFSSNTFKSNPGRCLKSHRDTGFLPVQHDVDFLGMGVFLDIPQHFLAI